MDLEAKGPDQDNLETGSEQDTVSKHEVSEALEACEDRFEARGGSFDDFSECVADKLELPDPGIDEPQRAVPTFTLEEMGKVKRNVIPLEDMQEVRRKTFFPLKNGEKAD